LIISLVEEAFQAIERHDSKEFSTVLNDILTVLRHANREMHAMWGRSPPRDYKKFLTFTLGLRNPLIFPRGVVLEGISDKPYLLHQGLEFHNSLIPTLDNLLELGDHLPSDFVAFRPHLRYVDSVQKLASYLGVRKFALSQPETGLLYLAVLDQLKEFRFFHWLLVESYIGEHPLHPGRGCPFAMWMQNQLRTVLEVMTNMSKTLDSTVKAKPLDYIGRSLKDTIDGRVATQKRILNLEEEELKRIQMDQIQYLLLLM